MLLRPDLLLLHYGIIKTYKVYNAGLRKAIYSIYQKQQQPKIRKKPKTNPTTNGNRTCK